MGCVCVFITAVPITTLFARGGGGSGGHVLQETTSRGLCELCVFITTGPSTKLFAWGGGDIGGHVLRETTSRGLCGLVCPSRTSERGVCVLLLQDLVQKGGERDCMKEGGGGEGKCEREC